ncbi:hypothetical protein SAMN04487881_0068 [Marinobacter sp. es.048]|uniref:hypothetical protein n=1 Tax=Marinobacter sp. es.048 TaxID=1761795 RepID=UPI000B58D831|nr:hypothetical protein [Marinobacter sp. es.048]SNC59498.1 hypothetical protein SAMN04487881_0068 [Marinobacter sp. es.048]
MEFLAPIFKVLAFIPGLKDWATRRFSKLEVTPVNGPGNNIFHLLDNESKFFVKLQFVVKAYTDMELVDLRMIYGKGFKTTDKTVVINNEELKTEGNYRLKSAKEIRAGKIYQVFLSERFFQTGHEEDYRSVILEFDLSAPFISGIVTTSAPFKLSAGGELLPAETKICRIR